MQRWVKHVALVTGASSGIGAAITKELVKHGMYVMGCARNPEKIEEMAEEARRLNYPGKLESFGCDMSHEDSILALHEEIQDRFGRLDVCINNALANIDSSLVQGSAKDWRRIIDVGVLGLCINTRESIKHMREVSANGHIIHIGSIVGHKLPYSQKTPETFNTMCFNIYYGVKAMTRVLAEGLRQELKPIDPPIRVSTISPGAVETEFFAKSIMKPEMAREFYRTYKCLQPQDVADAVTYILQSPPHVNIHDIILESVHFQI